jgi:hypothetical protein
VNDRNPNPSQGHPRTENVLLTRVGEDAVVRPLENVTIEDVKGYIDAERRRSRRSLVWTSTLLFCVFLFFTIVFLSLGLYMVRETRQLSDAVQSLQAAAGKNAQATADFSEGIRSVYLALDNVDDRVDLIEKSKTSIHQEYDALLVDMQRIKTAAGGADERMAEKFDGLASRITTSESVLRTELGDFRKTFAEKMLTMPIGAVRRSDNQGGAPAPGGMAGATVAVDAQGADARLAPMSGDAISGQSETGRVDIALLGPVEKSPDIRVVSYPSGDRFEGGMLNGLMHGWGAYYHLNGDRYEGQFEYDMKAGSGVMVFASGDRYEGQFASDARSGKGQMYYKNGDKYVGRFAHDAPSGNGVQILKNGNRYSGAFREGERHGNGTLEFANGDRYVGAFDAGMRSGRGTYVFSDGGRYVGVFHKGVRHGAGKYTYPGGDVYDGQFIDGQREGGGVFTQANGKRIKGLWKNGELMRRLTD